LLKRSAVLEIPLLINWQLPFLFSGGFLSGHKRLCYTKGPMKPSGSRGIGECRKKNCGPKPPCAARRAIIPESSARKDVDRHLAALGLLFSLHPVGDSCLDPRKKTGPWTARVLAFDYPSEFSSDYRHPCRNGAFSIGLRRSVHR